MIISCPNCFARYTLASDVMSEEGRKVRCSSCSNTWHATPNEAEAPVAAPVEEPPVSDDTADKLAAIRGAMEEAAAQDQADDVGESDEVGEKLDIEEDVQEADTENLDADDSGFDEDEDEDEDEVVEGVVEDGTSELDDIDDRFADDPEPSDDDLEFSEPFPADDFDDDEDFDEDLVTQRRRRQREEADQRSSSRRSQFITIGWIFLLLFMGTVFALFVAIPNKIVSWWPAAQTLYDYVGVSSEPEDIHDDVTATQKVEIKIYPTVYSSDGDNYILPLKGKFINKGTRTVTIPMVTYVLTGKDGVELAKGTFCLPSRMIMKNNSVEFEHIVENAPVGVVKAVIDIMKETDTKGRLIDRCATAS